jgi:MHS family alpha-ketoglutarate permease-like MFS transporter
MPAESTQAVEVRTLLASYSVGLSKQDAARVNFIALLVFLFLLLLGGLVSDKIGRTLC